LKLSHAFKLIPLGNIITMTYAIIIDHSCDLNVTTSLFTQIRYVYLPGDNSMVTNGLIRVVKSQGMYLIFRAL